MLAHAPLFMITILGYIGQPIRQTLITVLVLGGQFKFEAKNNTRIETKAKLEKQIYELEQQNKKLNNQQIHFSILMIVELMNEIKKLP